MIPCMCGMPLMLSTRILIWRVLVETDDKLVEDRETNDTVVDYLSDEDSKDISNNSEDDTSDDNNIIETCDTSNDD